jgi:hypothetical protein
LKLPGKVRPGIPAEPPGKEELNGETLKGSQTLAAGKALIEMNNHVAAPNEEKHPGRISLI